ncbi:MAG TPA: hypothetical protein VJW94_11740 [Candidatus Acidoferrum sp.]|nr:hypothetical protein [Candidatus Acidoferrum sp.]
MDELDRDNFFVLAVFGGSVAALIVGYLAAWRSKRALYRKAGSLMTAAVAGFAGLFMIIWMIGAVMPLPPPDGASIWEPLLALLILSPIPLGALYICAKFIRQASQDEPEIQPEKTETS